MKNIIFDLGGVILVDKPSQVLNKMNVTKDEYSELIRFFDNWDDLDLGYETLEEKFDKCNFSLELCNKYKDKLIHYYQLRDIDYKFIALANKLKNRGYNLYILTDNNNECVKYYMNSEKFSIFDGWVISSEYNTLKKDGKLFEILLNKYNLNGNECFFIDDKKENIMIAKTYGIDGLVYSKSYNDIENILL